MLKRVSTRYKLLYIRVGACTKLALKKSLESANLDIMCTTISNFKTIDSGILIKYCILKTSTQTLNVYDQSIKNLRSFWTQVNKAAIIYIGIFYK